MVKLKTGIRVREQLVCEFYRGMSIDTLYTASPIYMYVGQITYKLGENSENILYVHSQSVIARLSQ